MYQAEERSEAIRHIQTYLREIQIAEGKTVTVPIDGIYDSATKRAVEEFQREHGLPQSGEVDRRTYHKLYEAYRVAEFENSEPLPLYVFPKDRVISEGEVSDLVMIIQIILDALHYHYDEIPVLEINGRFTNELANVIRSFQMKNALPATGNVDKATWNAMVRNFNLYRDVGA